MYVINTDDAPVLFAEKGGRVWIEHRCLDREIMEATLANTF